LRIQRIDNLWEREGVKGGVNYIGLEGNIAVMANGAGLTMSLLDTIEDEGGRPACFLDTGGGLSKERMKNGVGLLLRKVKSDPHIKVILLMVRMMVSPPDAVAEGIIEALEEVKVKIPIIAIMRGREHYQKRAQELLKDSEVNLYSDIGEGTREAIKIAR
jgi:succinyl-CoA synthetase beta subunit